VTILDNDLLPTTADHSDFGSVLACSGTIVRTFTIENLTGANLTIGGVTLTGTNAGDFLVTTAPGSPVAAGNSTTFQVTFDPSAVGTRIAMIEIASNDPDENPYNFAIQGTGNADIVNPSITCPANISVNNTPAACGALVTYTAPVGTDNCPIPVTAQTSGLPSNTGYPTGVTTNVFRVTDGSGNTATCSFTVTVTDNEAPVLRVLSCNTSNASGTAYNDGWQSGDNDGTGFGPWALVASGTIGQSGFFVGSSTGNGAGTDTNADGDINSTGRALGMYANSAQGTQATRPIIGTFTIGSTIKADLDNGFVDSGQLVGFQLQNASGQSLGEVRFRGGQPTYELIDVNGITAFGTIPFTDEGITIEVTSIAAGVASMKLTRKVNGATQTLPMILFPQGGGQVIARVMFFDSNAGTTSAKDVFVNNMTACLATPGCPANQSITASSGQCTAPAIYVAPVAGDNCVAGPVTQTSGLASGASFPVGVTTNGFLVSDGSANTATCSFTVTVTDNQLPTITCPANVTGTNDPGLCSKVVTFTAPVGADNCASPITTQTTGLASGAAFPVGTTTNTFRVTDASGNTATCSFTVVISDNQLPTITCPANINRLATNTDCISSTVIFTAPVFSDNCPGFVSSQTAGLASGASYPLGATTNTFQIADAAGNTATCSFTVTVSGIANQTVSATVSTLCPNIGTNINLASSQAGVSYVLRLDSNDAVLAGPLAGTGSGLSFPTGPIPGTTTYNVAAVTPTAIDLDGVNDVVNFGNAINPTMSQYVLEAWVKRSPSGGIVLSSKNTEHIFSISSNGSMFFNWGNNVNCVWQGSGISTESIPQSVSSLKIFKLDTYGKKREF
jgi:hypothetical protein